MNGVVKELDREIVALTKNRERIDGEIKRLRQARALIVGERRGRKPRAAGAQTPGRAKAGPKAIESVQRTLSDDLHGRATQAAITKQTSLNSGQVSAALRDLEARGIVRRTGVREGRSHEFEMVSAGADGAATS